MRWPPTFVRWLPTRCDTTCFYPNKFLISVSSGLGMVSSVRISWDCAWNISCREIAYIISPLVLELYSQSASAEKIIAPQKLTQDRAQQKLSWIPRSNVHTRVCISVMGGPCCRDLVSPARLRIPSHRCQKVCVSCCCWWWVCTLWQLLEFYRHVLGASFAAACILINKTTGGISKWLTIWLYGWNGCTSYHHLQKWKIVNSDNKFRPVVSKLNRPYNRFKQRPGLNMYSNCLDGQRTGS